MSPLFLELSTYFHKLPSFRLFVPNLHLKVYIVPVPAPDLTCFSATCRSLGRSFTKRLVVAKENTSVGLTWRFAIVRTDTVSPFISRHSWSPLYLGEDWRWISERRSVGKKLQAGASCISMPAA